MITFSRLLKFLSKIVGLFLMLYGFFMGVIGIGPDGEVSLASRLVGLSILTLGFLYFIPNHKIVTHGSSQYMYFTVTLIPSGVLIFLACNTILSSGFQSFLNSGGLAIVVVALPLSFVAPLSLLTFILAQKSRGS